MGNINEPEVLEYVAEAQEMYNVAVNEKPWEFIYIPDQYKTQDVIRCEQV